MFLLVCRLQHCVCCTTRGHCVAKMMAIYQTLSPLWPRVSCLALSLCKLIQSQTDWTCIIKAFRTYCGGLVQIRRINHPAAWTQGPWVVSKLICMLHKFFLMSKMQRGSCLTGESPWPPLITIKNLFRFGNHCQKCVAVCVILGKERECDLLCLL